MLKKQTYQYNIRNDQIQKKSFNSSKELNIQNDQFKKSIRKTYNFQNENIKSGNNLQSLKMKPKIGGNLFIKKVDDTNTFNISSRKTKTGIQTLNTEKSGNEIYNIDPLKNNEYDIKQENETGDINIIKNDTYFYECIKRYETYITYLRNELYKKQLEQLIKDNEIK